MDVLGEKREFSYKDMLHGVMEQPMNAEKGAGIDEVRKSVRVLEQLDKSEDVLVLEDADYDHMMNKVKLIRFTSANQVVIDFVEDLEKAKDNAESKKDDK